MSRPRVAAPPERAPCVTEPLVAPCVTETPVGVPGVAETLVGVPWGARQGARRALAGDRGSATVWLLGMGLAVILLGGGAATVGAATVARHRARTAADAGALAGAARAVEGESVACARARELVVANGGRMVSCRLDDLDVVVRVEVDPAAVPAVFGPAEAAARAGPVRITG